MLYTLRFFLFKMQFLFHNANLFGSCIIHILYTGFAEIKKNNSGAKGLKPNYKFSVCYFATDRRTSMTKVGHSLRTHEDPNVWVRILCWKENCELLETQDFGGWLVRERKMKEGPNFKGGAWSKSKRSGRNVGLNLLQSLKRLVETFRKGTQKYFQRRPYASRGWCDPVDPLRFRLLPKDMRGRTQLIVGKRLVSPYTDE